MDLIKWCLHQRNGIKLAVSEEDEVRAFKRMATESMEALNNLSNSRMWTAVTSYYIFYYSLYALMQRIGIKCEIHACSIEFMKRYLRDIYSDLDVKMIERAFKARSDAQYYPNRKTDMKRIDKVKKYCKIFHAKSLRAASEIADMEVESIRESLKKEL